MIQSWAAQGVGAKEFATIFEKMELFWAFYRCVVAFCDWPGLEIAPLAGFASIRFQPIGCRARPDWSCKPWFAFGGLGDSDLWREDFHHAAVS